MGKINLCYVSPDDKQPISVLVSVPEEIENQILSTEEFMRFKNYSFEEIADKILEIVVAHSPQKTAQMLDPNFVVRTSEATLKLFQDEAFLEYYDQSKFKEKARSLGEEAMAYMEDPYHCAHTFYRANQPIIITLIAHAADRIRTEGKNKND